MTAPVHEVCKHESNGGARGSSSGLEEVAIRGIQRKKAARSQNGTEAQEEVSEESEEEVGGAMVPEREWRGEGSKRLTGPEV